MRVMVFVLADPLIRGSRAFGERGVLAKAENPPALRATPLIRGAKA
jgi:hypothetical protein